MTLASLGLPGMALADTGHLTWQHKSEPQAAPAPTVSSGGQAYAVPPSPYGQVGDPFARTLTWSGKGRAQPQQPPEPDAQPRPVATAPTPPPRQTNPGSASQRVVDAPRRDLANIDPLPVPQHPVPQVIAPVPVPQPRPVTVPEAALRTDPKPPVKSQAMPQKPVPQAPAVAAAKPAPQQPAPAAAPIQPVPPQMAANGYQVPATSKYAARIASARAAAAKQAADATPAANATPAKPAGKGDKKVEVAKATVPAPTPQMATEETDHVFIPGEQYKNATDAPRLYSLHRAYGLTPDPITVDHNATGAILDTADLDKVEEAPDSKAKDDNASDAASSSDSSKTNDSSPAKTADANTADTRKVTQ